MVRLDGVHVRHRARGGGLFRKDAVHALTDVSLEIRRGEILGLVGESGCGKSTLARVVTGLQRPTEGTVSFQGTDLWSMSPAARRERFGPAVGVVFQDPATALNPRLSVRRIVRDPLDVHRRGTPEQREARVRELLDLVGLPGHTLEALPGQLSGGQRQRVAIARALALDPELIVADEPTSALDVSVRAQILNLLVDLRARLGLGMVFISHDVQTVRYLADRIAVLYLGRVVEEGAASQVSGESRHPYTEALLSATPSLLERPERIVLHGPVPSATNPPSGCPFRTRCWKADETCATAFPPATEDAAGHRWHCVHPQPATATATAVES
ncbi:ABC transporter ATP-binding protein [Streptomyces albidoflavus]|uniref:ABC transporter ATP-binding protein n=1 Tax=Streptomyces albidoflavus TaxID=1886 RepID=A0AB37X5N0_9ACTN|nr:ABC transporter ATP-binding protein [Streptomyces sp. SM17]MBT2877410.1 ABC transporter ATP-binding protein [Streptomyces sp. McG6]MBT2884726.1 ABC transporter ATP-binding protein [Streptomyces sp. McG5]MBT2890239.1 ABC transporter ATP-binding protein [Streptomyces sp. McG2]MYX84929.1 ATP-binding cassette domain-containing protein [Streptomyces sp. SID4915]QLA60892.1 ABC transporter ATP-binding protein [Streptomyces violascens]RZE32207.1 ABC transporter ATP-binding protein [Streptomyces al